jgi:shikimate kinase
MPNARHIVLVGLPGAGKSTVGKLLAHRLQRPFVDGDEAIERRTGMTVAQIFATQGEDAFRELEQGVTREVAAAMPTVFAPGGGWITRPQTAAILRPQAQVVWLQVSPTEALRRMGPGALERPLLAPDPLARLQELLDSRLPFYGSADSCVDTELVSPQEVVDQLARLASDRALGVG